jgi:membrane-bound serine protease (ClpP class)
MAAIVRSVRRVLAGVALALAAAGALGAPSPAPPHGATEGTNPAAARERSGPPRVLSVTVDGAISGGTAEYLAAALRRARDERFDAVALTLDTPGGALDATREIVQGMLASEVPVIVWVGPAGARAASAGAILTIAANVAAMHPTSNIGAAHPVTIGGKDVASEAGKDMAEKVVNDTVAFVRSIAKERGRNADWAEKAVRESVSVTGEEALKLKVVDLLAPDLRAALDGADGRQVKAGGATRTVRSRDAAVITAEPTVRQKLLSFLADPNVVALLMLLGTLGIGIEFYHPGMIFPGAVGAFCLLLAFLAMRVIPVNIGAVILLLAGVGLLVAEGYVTAHGIAGVGGAICIVLGSAFFIDRASPDYQFDPGTFTVSPWIVWPTPVVLAGVLGFMAWKIARSRRAPLQLGAPALVGAEGIALDDLGEGAGQVFVHGEYWRARSAVPIPKGARVTVAAVDGLTLTVVAAAEASYNRA